MKISTTKLAKLLGSNAGSLVSTINRIVGVEKAADKEYTLTCHDMNAIAAELQRHYDDLPNILNGQRDDPYGDSFALLSDQEPTPQELHTKREAQYAQELHQLDEMKAQFFWICQELGEPRRVLSDNAPLPREDRTFVIGWILHPTLGTLHEGIAVTNPAKTKRLTVDVSKPITDERLKTIFDAAVKLSERPLVAIDVRHSIYSKTPGNEFSDGGEICYLSEEFTYDTRKV